MEKEKVTDPAVLQRLRGIFEQIVPIPDDEWTFASDWFYQTDFPAQAFLLREGEITDYSFVILKGIVRIFYILQNGREYNRAFCTEDMIAGSFSSMVARQPSRFYIQALEDAQTVLLYRPDVEKLYERNPCWERLGRLIAEYGLIKMEERESEILDSLETRYTRFVEQHPDIIARVPQYHIASHLGVTDVALSRLRKRMKLI